MRIEFTKPAIKQTSKLDKIIQNKFKKQLITLLQNIHHPSLKCKKMSGMNSYEARIDRRYRFRFDLGENSLTIISVGMHDEGLGKK